MKVFSTFYRKYGSCRMATDRERMLREDGCDQMKKCRTCLFHLLSFRDDHLQKTCDKDEDVNSGEWSC